MTVVIGLVHKTLFDLVERTAGGEALAEVKRRAGVAADQVFRIDTAYDDRQWRRLFDAACSVLGVTEAQAEAAFADFLCSDALARWPTWFRMCASAREFLERQPAIHNSFATGVVDPAMRATIRDKFRIERQAEKVIVCYRSSNRHCGLYAAAARWIIDHYGDDATVREARCMKKGDPECEFHVQWT